MKTNRTCKYCGEPIKYDDRLNKKFCSDSCRSQNTISLTRLKNKKIKIQKYVNEITINVAVSDEIIELYNSIYKKPTQTKNDN